jgi:thioredoxin reductase
MSDRGVEDVDLLVVGGGKAGKSLAMDRAQAGWEVAMVERDKIGGTCINVACIPTKALVGSARTVLMGRHAKVMGVELNDQPLVSLDGLRRHKSSVVDGMVAAHKKMFADSGMDFILGTARFIAPRTVEVETRNEPIRLLRANIVINTGTAPAIPDLAGISESRVWTSETILQLERLPQRLIVLGGGYVGCEFASMFALFGIQVTLLQGPDQLLPREDSDVAGEVAGILANQGVGLGLGIRAQAVRRDASTGEVVAVLEDGSHVRGEESLVATGRAPVTADLGWRQPVLISPIAGSSGWTTTFAPQLVMSGRPVTSPAVRSSPMLHGTTSASSRRTSTTVRRSPEVASCPTPSLLRLSWRGWASPRPKPVPRDATWQLARFPFQRFRGPRPITTRRALGRPSWMQTPT